MGEESTVGTEVGRSDIIKTMGYKGAMGLGTE